MLKLSVEVTVQERGQVSESRGYLRDSEIEIEELLKYTKSQLIVIADQALKEEQAKGFDKSPVLVVDGRRNKRPIDVSPLGQIEFVSRQNIAEVLLEAYEGLLHRSKVLTGRYKSSHYVFHRGFQVATDLQTLKTWLLSNPRIVDNDTIRIVNIQPYARRLELLGVTAQRTSRRTEDAGRRSKRKTGTLIKVPNGAYQLTARALRTKYKQNLGIRFNFLPGSSLGLSGSFRGGRGKNSSGRPYLYPSLIFTISTRGLL